MSKPIGGRGNKAPYEQTHVRVPLPIKGKVEELKEMFLNGSLESYEQLLRDDHKKAREYEKLLTGLSINSNPSRKPLPTLENALEMAKNAVKQKKGASLTIIKLLSDLYGVKLSVDDLKD